MSPAKKIWQNLYLTCISCKKFLHWIIHIEQLDVKMTIDETQQSVTEAVHAQTSSQSPLRRQNSNSDNQSVKFRVILMLSRGMRLAHGLVLYSLLKQWWHEYRVCTVERTHLANENVFKINEHLFLFLFYQINSCSFESVRVWVCLINKYTCLINKFRKNNYYLAPEKQFEHL